jgi:hypothetical protein
LETASDRLFYKVTSGSRICESTYPYIPQPPKELAVKRIVRIAIIACASVLASCASTSSLLNSGKYDEAYALAAQGKAGISPENAMRLGDHYFLKGIPPTQEDLDKALACYAIAKGGREAAAVHAAGLLAAKATVFADEKQRAQAMRAAKLYIEGGQPEKAEELVLKSAKGVSLNDDDDYREVRSLFGVLKADAKEADAAYAAYLFDVRSASERFESDKVEVLGKAFGAFLDSGLSRDAVTAKYRDFLLAIGDDKTFETYLAGTIGDASSRDQIRKTRLDRRLEGYERSDPLAAFKMLKERGDAEGMRRIAPAAIKQAFGRSYASARARSEEIQKLRDLLVGAVGDAAAIDALAAAGYEESGDFYSSYASYKKAGDQDRALASLVKYYSDLLQRQGYSFYTLNESIVHDAFVKETSDDKKAWLATAEAFGTSKKSVYFVEGAPSINHVAAIGYAQGGRPDLARPYALAAAADYEKGGKLAAAVLVLGKGGCAEEARTLADRGLRALAAGPKAFELPSGLPEAFEAAWGGKKEGYRALASLCSELGRDELAMSFLEVEGLETERLATAARVAEAKARAGDLAGAAEFCERAMDYDRAKGDAFLAKTLVAASLHNEAYSILSRLGKRAEAAAELEKAVADADAARRLAALGLAIRDGSAAARKLTAKLASDADAAIAEKAAFAASRKAGKVRLALVDMGWPGDASVSSLTGRMTLLDAKKSIEIADVKKGLSRGIDASIKKALGSRLDLKELSIDPVEAGIAKRALDGAKLDEARASADYDAVAAFWIETKQFSSSSGKLSMAFALKGSISIARLGFVESFETRRFDLEYDRYSPTQEKNASAEAAKAWDKAEEELGAYFADYLRGVFMN